jgi:hypothetical protein
MAKDQFTLVDEEEMELETDYGVYLAVMAVETKFQIEEAASLRRQYVIIYEIDEEEQGFWKNLWNILRTKRPILLRTYIPNDKQIENIINGWIINWELPRYQIEKAKQGGEKLRINYERELERRTKKIENLIEI